MADRAQTEVLGFASLFAVVMLAVLVVTATAYPGLRNVEEFQRVENAEQGMVSFAENVDDLLRADAPSRSTRLDADTGQLRLGAPVTVTVNGSNATGLFSASATTRPLVYRASDGTELVYSNGAVLRSDRGGVVMVREPQVVLSGDGVVLSLVEFRRERGPRAVEGATRVVTTRRNTRLLVAENDVTAGTLTVSITSAHVEAWEASLEGRPGVTCAPIAGQTLTCTVDAERAHVTSVAVDVAFR